MRKTTVLLLALGLAFSTMGAALAAVTSPSYWHGDISERVYEANLNGESLDLVNSWSQTKTCPSEKEIVVKRHAYVLGTRSGAWAKTGDRTAILLDGVVPVAAATFTNSKHLTVPDDSNWVQIMKWKSGANSMTGILFETEIAQAANPISEGGTSEVTWWVEKVTLVCALR